jgi:hypothetical protein
MDRAAHAGEQRRDAGLSQGARKGCNGLSRLARLRQTGLVDRSLRSRAFSAHSSAPFALPQPAEFTVLWNIRKVFSFHRAC